MYMKLPDEIDKYIFEDLEGYYKPDPERAKYCEYLDKDDIKWYLGTYWPRSFTELYYIFNDLITNKEIEKIFNDKNEFNILDIGSGTGGNLFGYLWFMKNNIKGFENKKINIYIIDSKPKSVNKGKKLLDQFFPELRNSHKYEKKEFKSREHLEESLKKILEQWKCKFDIIMSCKFVNEFYRSNKDAMDEIYNNYETNKGMYKTITEIVSDFMKKDALFVLLDNVDSISFAENDIFNWTFFSKLMSKEILTYLRSNDAKLKLIMPLSCAFWYDCCREYNNMIYNKNEFDCYTRKKFYLIHSKNKYGFQEIKVTYKIFAFKEKADKILSEIEKQDCYNLAIGENKICRKGKYDRKNELAAEYKDAFSFRDNLK